MRPPSRRPTGAAPVAALAASLCLASCQPRVSSRPALALLGPIPIRLVEMAGPAGVRFTHQNGASAQKYFPEIMGAGVGLLDYDGDGRVDLLFVNGREWRRPGPESTLRLYRNETTPAANDHPVGPPVLKFREVTREAGLTLSLYGMGCAVGDYNGDGWPDVYVSGAVFGGRLLRNNRGKFQDVTLAAGVGNQGRWGAGCAWLDYDRDGWLDLYIANYVRYASLKDDRPCEVLPGRRSYCIPQSYDGESGVLYRNLRNGLFQDVTREVGLFDAGQKGLGVLAQDLDGNGWVDLAVANDTTGNRLFLNDEGHFQDLGVVSGFRLGSSGRARAGMGICAADSGNDGGLAIVVTNFARESVGFYARLEGDEPAFEDRADDLGVAQPSAPWLGFGTVFADVDNDGFQDLLVVNGHIRDDIAVLEPGQSFAQPALLLRSRSGGQYEEMSSFAGPPLTTTAVRRGLAAGDLDNDGRLDLVVTSNGGPAEIWRNECPPMGRWLSVRLQGRPPNRDALGAQVRVRVGDRSLSRVVASGGSYLSESDRRLHWGLGGAAAYDALEVRWPDGTRQNLPGGPANRFLTLRQERN